MEVILTDHQLNSLLSNIERIPFSGCWIYMGSIGEGGYGIFYPKHKVAKKVHRLIYEKIVGQIPHGMKACHRCDTPSCCNPDHIFVGTQAENVQDAAAKKRMRAPGGQDSPHAKLDWEIVRIIRASDKGAFWWARRLGMAKSTIAKIIDGRSWKVDPQAATDNRG
ncbi:HNH endonuclease [Burkholderia pseudomallei]|nr:HNH endonuclease [Burkholderia pseudomallei]